PPPSSPRHDGHRPQAAFPPRRPRGRKHPHLSRGAGGFPPPGDAVFDRQGLVGAVAPAAQGVPSGEAGDADAARRHHLEVPRDDRVPRPGRGDGRRGAAGAHQPGRRAPGHLAADPRRHHAYRRDEDPGAEAGAGPARLRRRDRRRAPRRGEIAREGAHLLVPQCAAPLGSEEPAPRAVAQLQHLHPQGRERARVPAVQLDRDGRVAVHPAREHPGGAAVLRQAAPGGGARRRPDHGRRRPLHPARGRNHPDARGALPHAGLLSADGRRGILGRYLAEGDRRDGRLAHLRAPGPGDRPRPHRVDGAQEAGGLFLMGAQTQGTPAAPEKGLLRFITCGSVDDGKSTLLGRLLYDAGMLSDDQLVTLARESRRQHADAGEDVLDFALLTDGLDAEREQGITIDVAYRYFHTARRSFIVADCPGHEQYTRNMATGASNAELAVVLVDARKGLLPQTRRHTYICGLLGIRHVVLAVNKMDLVGYDRGIYEAIATQYRELAQTLGIDHVQCLPVSALTGENVGSRSSNMPWHDGGSVARGDEIVVQPGVQRARIERIVTFDGDLDRASEGQAVTLCFDRELDASRGDVIADALRPAPVADQFTCHLLWMGDNALLPNRTYCLKIGTRTVSARVMSIKHKVDVNSQARLAAR